MDIQLNSKIKIGQNYHPYIIAEIGSNHNGNLGLCKKMIDAAKNSGANCVKFQTFSANSLFSKKMSKEMHNSKREKERTKNPSTDILFSKIHRIWSKLFTNAAPLVS